MSKQLLRRIVILALVLAFQPVLLCAQVIPDSLQQQLNNAGAEEKASALNRIADFLVFDHPESAFDYASQGLEAAEKSGNKWEQINALLIIGDSFYYREQYQAADEYYSKALEKSKKEDFPDLIARAHYFMAYNYDILNRVKKARDHYHTAIHLYDSLGRDDMVADLCFYLATLLDKSGENFQAKTYYERSLQLYDSLGQKNDEAETLNSLGVLYYDWGNYEKAIGYYNISLSIMRELESKSGIAQVLNNLGLLYQDMKNYAEALKYYEESLALEEETGDKYGIAGAYNNIGLIHAEWNELDKAEDYYERALAIYEDVDDKSGIATALNNLGEIYIQTGQPDLAVIMLEKSLRLEKEIDDKYGIALAYATLSKIHQIAGNLKRSLLYNDSSMTLARQISNPEVLQAAYKNYYEINRSEGNYVKALDYYIEMTELKDSLFNQDLHKQLTEVKSRYELEQKEQEIALLNARNKLDQLDLENKKDLLQRQRTIMIIAITGFMIILVIMIILQKQVRDKKAAYKTLDQQNKEILQSREDLNIAKEKAEESDRLKSIFLANMSHELRTPLNGILGFTEVLRTELIDEEFREMAEIIHVSGTRLHETLNSIIDLSIIESNRMEIDYSEFRLEELISDAITLYRVSAFKKNLELAGEITDQTSLITSDRKILANLLNNLIDNAVKYTHEGGVKVEAHTTNRDGQAYLVIQVTDTGIGIDEERLKLIFDKFRQGSEGHDRQFEGAGLGLTICKKYVELLGGEIIAKSRQNQGSEFRLEIPVNIPEGEHQSYEKPEITQGYNLPHSPHKADVLIVENDEINLKHLQYVLKENYNVDSATNGTDAIHKAHQRHFDIILMDINLGAGPNGMETARNIKQITGYAETPIIAVTANAMKGHREQFLSNGCTHYISKPFSSEKLKQVMYDALEGNK